MSKKPVLNRLDRFFTDLGEKVPAQPEIRSVVLPAWTWQANQDGIYIGCSPEVEQALGVSALKWLGKSIFSFKISSHSAKILQKSLESPSFPVEVDLEFEDKLGKPAVIRMTLFQQISESGDFRGWRGYNQILSRAPVDASRHTNFDAAGTLSQIPAALPSSGKSKLSFAGGFARMNGKVQPSDQPWTNIARKMLANPGNYPEVSQAEDMAMLAIPITLANHSNGVVEILDENSKRKWSEDDRQLVEEVARQLALALENAQLYASAQQELSDRMRAEQETLKRNQELSLLNQVGQQLSKLTSQHELLSLVQKSIGELVDNKNLTISLFNSANQTISFPIHTCDGTDVALADRPLKNEIVDFVYHTRSSILANGNVEHVLVELGVDLPDRMPSSLLAIPMLAGDRPVGAIILQDFDRNDAYTNVDAELLSTIATQATTALENTNLFQEISGALQALETRERYQASVAKSVAALTQFGTLALPDVLNNLSLAARNSRTYYAEVSQQEQTLFWHSISEWRDPYLNLQSTGSEIQFLAVEAFPNWAFGLRDHGWVTGTLDELPSPERDFMAKQGIGSILLLAVPGKFSTPNFLAFEQLGEQRRWLSEEIDGLRVVADALSNTIIREDLFERLQVSLDETENLYNASHRLALASDLKEMVAAIALDINSPSINRVLLALYGLDPQTKTRQLKVAATWHSGEGTPPLPEGANFGRPVYAPQFTNQTPSFIDDILDSQIDTELRDDLIQQNVRSLAVLPLWANKKQLGVLVLESESKHQFTGRETRSYPPLADQMATAIENQNLFAQTQAALAETGLLYQISSGVAQASTPDMMVNMVSSHLLPKAADRASLFLSHTAPDGQIISYEVVGYLDKTQENTRLGMRIPASDLPIFKLATETLIFNDIVQASIDPFSKSFFQSQGIRTLCLVPLMTAGKLSGVLAVSSGQVVEFSTEEIHLLQISSAGIAVALERYQLLNQTQRRALELQTAAEIARDTTSTLEIGSLLARITQLVQERFGFYHVSIFLLDQPGNFAVVREAAGAAGAEMKSSAFKLAVGSKSVIGSTTSSANTVVVNDVSTSPYFLFNPSLPDTKSEIGIPLKVGDRVIGALDIHANQANAFSHDDITVLQILADQIAVAIENARAYELSQKAYEDMKEVDRVKSQFLANMSHELRTPLNSIIGFSRVILKGIDGPINETQKQDLSAIYNSGQHLLTLINNILDLSKIEAGKMELQFTEFALTDLINSVMSTAAGLVKDKPIRLHQQVPTDLPLVRADQTRIRQVLLNFISNAAKFTEEGTISVEAMVVSSPKGKREVMVTISDTGTGIAPADQGKLFQPFSQVDDSPTRKTGGTGLGLSICRSMIEMHNGRIGLLRSEIGKGSTFFFTLPLASDDQDTKDQRLKQTSVIASIDDDPQVISLYRRYLVPQGYQVEAITEPKQAVERVKEIKPFAITLDIMMPEIDGWQILQQLKNDPATREIPIIICSILEDEEKGFNLGAADYLVKPFLQEDLINAINHLNHDGKIHEILVIDDDPEDLRLIQKMLDGCNGYHLTFADGGENGWEMLRSSHPDAVILDLFMPDLDGFTLLGNLRANPQFRELPVIVLTGADLTAEQHAKLTLLGQQMLTKGSLRERELLNTLEVSLRKVRN